MRIKHEQVDFKISRRTLWVGMQAFPLPQVTRVMPREIKPNHGRTVVNFSRRAGATLGLGLTGLFLLSCAGRAAPPAAYALVAAVTLAALALQTYRLVQGLRRRPLYVLSISTAGTARTALCSPDRELIHDLTQRIVDAIDDPAASYQITVEHLEVAGDVVNGGKYGGDHVEGDKYLEGWS